MSIPFSCQCGKSGKAKDELDGKTVKCPACGISLKITRPTSATVNAQQPQTASNAVDDDFGDLSSLERSGAAVDSPFTHLSAVSQSELDASQQAMQPAGLQPTAPTPVSPAPQSTFTPDSDEEFAGAKASKSNVIGNLNKPILIIVGGVAATFFIIMFMGIAAFVLISNSSTKLEGHHDGVLTVAYANNGQRLVSSSRDGTVKVWDARSGELITSISGQVAAASISPDGKWVATTGDTISLWNADTGKLKENLKFSSEDRSWEPVCVAFSPNGKWLAAGGRDGMAIWSLSGSDHSEPTVSLRKSAACLAFSPDSSLIAIGHGNPSNREGATIGDVELLETETGDQVDGWGVGDMMGRTSCLSFSSDGKMLAVATADTEALVAGTPGLNKSRSELHVWAVPSGQPLLSVSPKIKQCTAVFFTNDNESIIVAGGNPFVTMKSGSIKRFDIASGELETTMKKLSVMVLCAAASPDGKKIAWASGDMDTGDSIGSAIKRAQGRTPDAESRQKTMDRRLATMRFQISPL